MIHRVSLVERAFKLEDKAFRLFFHYPKVSRKNSFPYFSSDTYYYLCDKSIEHANDVDNLKNFLQVPSLYINGNLTSNDWDQILRIFDESQPRIQTIVIGDSDIAPDKAVLQGLKRHCDRLYSVNLRENSGEGISSIPLGLESQRYRSAGQLRDFRKKIHFNADNRKIGVLVAWNDSTSSTERKRARTVLAPLSITEEVKKRVTARYIHHLMKNSLFVACPRGNGLDTHRFWEALYLGSIPIIVKKDAIPAFEFGPHFAIEDWKELENLSMQDLRKLYVSKESSLKDFCMDSRAILMAIFGSK